MVSTSIFVLEMVDLRIYRTRKGSSPEEVVVTEIVTRHCHVLSQALEYNLYNSSLISYHAAIGRSLSSMLGCPICILVLVVAGIAGISTPTADDISLEIKLPLQQSDQQSLVLAGICCVKLVVGAHHRGDISPDRVGKGPKVQLPMC